MICMLIKLYDEALHDLHCSPNCMIRTSRFRLFTKVYDENFMIFMLTKSYNKNFMIWMLTKLCDKNLKICTVHQIV